VQCLTVGGYGPEKLDRVASLFAPARSVSALPDGGILACDSYAVYEWDPRGRLYRGLSHRLFADVHWADQAPDGRLFVASTEADAVVLLDWSERADWGWWADEHGWGTRGLPHDMDWRSYGINSAQQHLAHINCARWLNPKQGVLITLLGRCEKGPVWRDSHVLLARPYGETFVLKAGLLAAHHALPTERGFAVVESQGCRVSEWTWDGELLWEYRHPDLWWAKAAVPFDVEGERLWLLGLTLTKRLRCVDAAGRTRWEKELPGEPYCIAPF
jgi:hypothetical protein